MSRTSLIAALSAAVLSISALATSASAETNPKDETKTDLDGAILQSKVYFAFDKAELDDEGRTALAEAAEWFKAHPKPSVVIEGHTDLVGDLAYNRKLSDSRAETTKAYLVSLGVNPSRIRILPYGEGLPVIETEDRERANRRIQIYSVSNEPIVRTETITKTETEYVTVDGHRITPVHYSLTAGGGLVHSLSSNTRDMTNLGGTWNVRFTARTRHLIGGEIAYVGTSQDLDNEMGFASDAAIISNGVEGGLRVALPNAALQPYFVAGVGYMHYDVTGSSVPDVGDNVIFFPAALGVTYRRNHLVADLRGTVRAAYDEELFNQMGIPGETDLSNWEASAQLGWEF